MRDDPYAWRLPEDYTEHYGNNGEEFADADTSMRFAVETGRLPVADD